MNASLEELQKELDKSWDALAKARAEAISEQQRIASFLPDVGTTDAAIVAFGSLARKEWTCASDVDWTLLIDSPAKPEQRLTVRDVKTALELADIKNPNANGPFGSMSFSHELVHRIGGDADTNRITTQRVLLLLESVPISEAHRLVHDRVVRAILNSYLEQYDPISRDSVPRFLLNDVVRYWRTVAVDAAAKVRERGEKGWQLRRLKLRTSRKLIFAAGLVMSFETYGQSDVAMPRDRILESLTAHVRESPLDRLARAALQSEAMLALAVPVFDAYDEFLSLIDTPEYRAILEEVDSNAAQTNAIVAEARRIGQVFGQSIESFFFDEKSRYAKAIRSYGVF